MEFISITKDFLKYNISVFKEIIANTENEYWEDEHFLFDLPEKWTLSICVIVDTQIAGFIIASKKDTTVHIHKFFVKSSLRSQKIGELLLFELYKKIKEDKELPQKISLKVYKINTRAIQFYLKHNFINVSSTQDLYLLEKTV